MRDSHPGSTRELPTLRDLDGRVHGMHATTTRARLRHLASIHVPIQAPARPLTCVRLAGFNVADAEGRVDRWIGALARPTRAADLLVGSAQWCQRLRGRCRCQSSRYIGCLCGQSWPSAGHTESRCKCVHRSAQVAIGATARPRVCAIGVLGTCAVRGDHLAGLRERVARVPRSSIFLLVHYFDHPYCS